jgi:coproporphyrinogen III oxidase-like Fe-S oxidoreductase
VALSLYVRWPSEDPTGRWVCLALGRALAGVPGGAAGRRLVSVLIDAADAPPASSVRALLADAAGRLDIASDVEVTLATDPGAIPAPLAAYRAAGINRIALRAGTIGAAQAVLPAAAELFPRIALDLTFARPGQTVAAWRAELDRAVQLGVGHISIEEHVAAADGADPDQAAALFQVAIDQLSAAGLPPYEIAHFARPGQESRQLVHGATGGDYLGIGPGAFGRITAGGVCYASSQIERASAWLGAVETGAEAQWLQLGAEQRLTELLLTGLRLRAGIERTWFEPLAGEPLEAVLPADRLAAVIEDGFVVLDRRGLRLTERGWPLCDGMLARLLN